MQTWDDTSKSHIIIRGFFFCVFFLTPDQTLCPSCISAETVSFESQALERERVILNILWPQNPILSGPLIQFTKPWLLYSHRSESQHWCVSAPQWLPRHGEIKDEVGSPDRYSALCKCSNALLRWLYSSRDTMLTKIVIFIEIRGWIRSTFNKALLF